MELLFSHTKWLLTCAILFMHQIFLAQVDPSQLNLHVPSPTWEDQIIYFLMTDRFNDGDPSNNDQGFGEYDPQIPEKYSGGDIQGVIEKLEYIQTLGATTVWVTPPVANQWWDGKNKFSGYHGYWASNFKEVDKHLGTLVDYQLLSHHLHQRGMYLIQDIVINHTGNYYGYPKNTYNPEDPTAHFELNQQSLPSTSPSQYPFTLNDPRNPEHLAASVYHWTPNIEDYNDTYQKINYELGALDDINTQNVLVREVFRDSYGYWIRVVGVDGFRIDTVIYVEKEFWNDFMNNNGEKSPGMNLVAKSTGRENFIAFGESFLNSKPYSDTGDREVANVIGTDEKPGLNSMINFPLYFTIGRVFAQGKPTSYLAYRLNTIVNSGIYPSPHQLVNFIDNHDTNRFLENATKEGFQQALFFQFSIPGIPVIYMGTEQLFHEPRASMFAGGWGSHDQDHFDEGSEMYQFLQQLSVVRKANKVLTRGDFTILQDSDLGPGVLAFRRRYEGAEVIILFNTADQPILLSNLETGLSAGTKLKMIHGLHMDRDLEAGKNGWITAELPQRSAGIFQVEKIAQQAEKEELSVDFLTDIAGNTYSEDISVRGTIAHAKGEYVLVIDGKLQQAIPLAILEEGKWDVTIPISRFPFGKSDHKLTIFSPEQQLSSPVLAFSTDIDIRGETVRITDPTSDDNGPDGTYLKPLDASYGLQMDIRAVKATAFGGNLRLELEMGELSQIWLPPNGFDHVLFHVFIDLPESEGADYIPMLNTPAPEGFKWDYAAYIAGWLSAFYSSQGASREHYGTKLSTPPSISVDQENRTIMLQFSPDALGNPKTLEGANIYITTWDCNGSEGGYRRMAKKGELWKFGGSDDPNPVRIMDDTEVITIGK